MKTLDFVQIGIYVLLVVIFTPVLGKYMFSVFTGKNNLLTPVFGKIEKFIYKLMKINSDEKMDWKKYLFSILIFNFSGLVFLLILQMLQQWLPLNPQNLPNVPFHLALNTAISFVSNTNWQAYGGESTMSYLVQMLGLTVQNFLSAATGIAVFLALVRGITSKLTDNLGNFWVDATRSVLYLLIPLSIVLSIFLMSQGAIQNFSNYQSIFIYYLHWEGFEKFHCFRRGN